jgi:tetratricopeptide (TPR) repeat protein
MHLGKSLGSTFATWLFLAAPMAAQFGGPSLPESARPAQGLIRQGKLEEALATYQKALADSPDSPALHSAMGSLFDLMGRSADAHAQFARAIELSGAPDARAQQERAMAMSYAFAGDCGNAVKYEQMVIAYWATREQDDPGNAFYQEGEMADEAARVCIDNGDLDAANKWYKAGHDYGIKQPGITPVLRDLWEFRWEHAQARIAARRGDKAGAQQHVAAAKAILDKDDQLAHGSGRGENQSQFMPYLTGYVALYLGDYKAAADDLKKAIRTTRFINACSARPTRSWERRTRRWSVTARPGRRRPTIRRPRSLVRSRARN